MKDLKQIDENNWELSKNQVLRKTKKGYRVIYPIKTQGKINWRNILIGDGVGVFYVIIFIILAFTYVSDTETCREIIEDFYSREICSKNMVTIDPYGKDMTEYSGFNISNLNGGNDELGLPLPS